MGQESAIDLGASARQAATKPSLVGTTIAGKYRVDSLIGSGSTGDVYLCRHVGLDKIVALKVLHADMVTHANFVERFKREARAASRLEHPNSVRVLDFGEDPNGVLYIAMEYIAGRDLWSVLDEEWPLDNGRIVSIMCQVLSALSTAHNLGIVHRDLKPENIMVRRTSGEEGGKDLVTVCDFGIAQLSPIQLAGAYTPLTPVVTGDGMVVGTPAYMSPEQARAEPLDARSDVYSAGVVLFQMLTRQLPFTAETPLAVAVMHCSNAPPAPSQLALVHPRLERVCLKALNKNKEQRFQGAREMMLALEEALTATAAPQGRRQRKAYLPLSLPPASQATRRVPSSLIPVERERPSDPEPIRANPAGRRALGVAGMVILLGGLTLSQLIFNREPTRGRDPLTQPPAHSGVASSSSLADPPLAHEPEGVASGSAHAPSEAAQMREPKASQTLVREPKASQTLVREPEAGQTLVNAPQPEVQEQAQLLALDTVVRGRAATETAAARERGERGGDAAARERGGDLSARERADRAARTAPVTKPAAQKAPPASPARVRVQPLLEGEAEALALSPVSVTELDRLTGSIELIEASATSDKPAASGLKELEPVPDKQDAVAHAPAKQARVELTPIPSSGSHSYDDASVAIGSIDTHAAVSKASIRNALNQSAMTRCYRDALRMGAASPSVSSASLVLTTNMGGRIDHASVTSQGLPKALQGCIEQVARAGRIREVDTGVARATVTLEFQP